MLRQQVKQVWDLVQDGLLVVDVGRSLASQGLYNQIIEKLSHALTTITVGRVRYICYQSLATKQ